MAETASLIPKRTLGGGSAFASSVGVGVFFRVSFIIFLVSAMLSGGLYLAKKYITNNLNEEKSLLKKINQEFEPTLIADLERLAKSIRAAKLILKDHVKISKKFELLEAHTLNNVAFSEFSFVLDKNSIIMSGESPTYTAIAAQASAFGALSEVAAVEYSDMKLGKTGSVGFTIEIRLKP